MQTKSQAYLETFSKNWDLYLTAAIVLSFFVGYVNWSPLAGYRFLGSEAKKQVHLLCEAGNCWVRPQGQLNLYPLPVGVRVPAQIGDEAMTMGEDSKLVAEFDGEGELHLSRTGVIRVAQGEQTVGESSNSANASMGQSATHFGQAAPAPSTLMYMGEIPIKIVSPAAGSPIVATAFPVALHLAFLVEKARPEDLARLTEWLVVDLKNVNAPKKVASVKAGMVETSPRGTSFFGEFSVARAGSYALVPSNMDVSVKNLTFRFEVKPASALEGQITDLLRGVTSGIDNQIEVRGK